MMFGILISKTGQAELWRMASSFCSLVPLLASRTSCGIAFALRSDANKAPLNAKVNKMKRLLFGLGTLLALTLVTPDAMAQQRRGNGGAGQGGSEAVRTRVRADDQSQAGIRACTAERGQSQSPHGNQGPAGSKQGNQSSQPSGLLSANTGDLLRLREEEKLARDVYTNLAKTSKLNVFRNISRAESQHMQVVERLIGGANRNALNDVPGSFTDPDYQQLYQSLVASGSRSPLDALMVGAKIEEMDITDLKRLLTQTNRPQVRQVLEQLMRGSQNHLRAFASQIAKRGASYNAEFLTQAEFDQIASSSGRGHGRQSGRQHSVGRGANESGQGSANLRNGQQFGFRGQSTSGQGFGASSQYGDGGRQGRGNQRRGR